MINSSSDNSTLYKSINEGSDNDKLKKTKLKKLRNLNIRFP